MCEYSGEGVRVRGNGVFIDIAIKGHMALCVTGTPTKMSEADLVIGDGVMERMGELEWVW